MQALRTLTLLYAATLVPTLAASLVAIWVYLRRIATVLGDVRAALEAVRDEAVPLREHLQRLEEASVGSARELATAREGLARAADGLTMARGQPDETEPAP